MVSPVQLATVFGTSAGSWTPYQLGDALKFWVSSDDHGTARMTDDGAGLISSVTDRAGGMVLTATGAARPTWTATAFNSAFSGWTLDGLAQCFVSTSLGTIPTGSTPGTIFMLLSQGEPTATTNAIRYGTGAAAADRCIQRVTSTSSRLRITDVTTSLTDTASVFDGPHIVIATWSGTTESGRLDGQATSPASATIGSLATGTTRLRLFANNLASAGGWFKGAASDVIMTTAISLLQYQQLEGWAAWNKGLVANLPVAHPYKFKRP